MNSAQIRRMVNKLDRPEKSKKKLDLSEYQQIRFPFLTAYLDPIFKALDESSRVQNIAQISQIEVVNNKLRSDQLPAEQGKIKSAIGRILHDLDLANKISVMGVGNKFTINLNLSQFTKDELDSIKNDFNEVRAILSAAHHDKTKLLNKFYQTRPRLKKKPMEKDNGVDARESKSVASPKSSQPKQTGVRGDKQEKPRIAKPEVRPEVKDVSDAKQQHKPKVKGFRSGPFYQVRFHWYVSQLKIIKTVLSSGKNEVIVNSQLRSGIMQESTFVKFLHSFIPPRFHEKISVATIENRNFKVLIHCMPQSKDFNTILSFINDATDIAENRDEDVSAKLTDKLRQKYDEELNGIDSTQLNRHPLPMPFPNLQFQQQSLNSGVIPLPLLPVYPPGVLIPVNQLPLMINGLMSGNMPFLLHQPMINGGMPGNTPVLSFQQMMNRMPESMPTLASSSSSSHSSSSAAFPSQQAMMHSVPERMPVHMPMSHSSELPSGTLSENESMADEYDLSKIPLPDYFDSSMQPPANDDQPQMGMRVPEGFPDDAEMTPIDDPIFNPLDPCSSSSSSSFVAELASSADFPAQKKQKVGQDQTYSLYDNTSMLFYPHKKNSGDKPEQYRTPSP